jgi:hypothetical protein
MSAKRTKTYASADLADADGVKISAATSASPVTILAAAMNGAAMGSGGVLDLPRTVSVTSSASVGSYAIASPIVVTGKRGGETVTENLTLTATGGNETIYGTQAFDSLTSIAIPAMVNTSGAFTFGVADICAPAGDTFSAVKCDTAVTLYVKYGESSTSKTDATAVLAKTPEFISPTRVRTTSGTTSGAAVTVYLG